MRLFSGWFRNCVGRSLRLLRRVRVLPFAVGFIFALETDGAEWIQKLGYRQLPLTVTLPTDGDKQERQEGFTLMAAERTGIHFTNTLGAQHALTNHIYMNGSGVALGDIDGDGRVDIYLCGLNGPNVLYKNLGDWRFEDITTGSGVTCDGQYSTGAAFADINGNGHLDLLVTGVGAGVRLFLNDGTGRFQEGTDAAGLRSVDGSMSVALADVDGDGALDLYVANYRTWTMRDYFNLPIRVRMVNGRPEVSRVFGRPITDPDLQGRFTVEEGGGLQEHGEVDAFFRNDGTGRFTKVSFTDGTFLDESGQPLTVPPYDWGLSAMFRDITGNGFPDLYVCNDLISSDRIWLNLGDGRFQAMNSLALRKGSWFSMGVDFGDLNRNGLDDFFVVDMLSRDHAKRQVQVGGHMRRSLPLGAITNRPRYSRNTLYWNQGDGSYIEAAFHAGVHASEWSWSPIFLDVDLDGYEDILISTGFERDVQDIDVAERIEATRVRDRLPDAAALALRSEFPRLADPNVVFRNRGDGTFEDKSMDWGFDQTGISQGMAVADLDGDGDLDVVINNMNSAPFLLKNQSRLPRIAVRLRGNGANTRGIGAKIRVLGGPTIQSQEMMVGGRYLSSDEPVRVFAAGQTNTLLTVEVLWPGGRRSVLRDIPSNHLYEIQELAADDPQPSVWDKHLESAGLKPRWGPPHFEDATGALRHRHVEDEYDDYASQPLLPRRFSRLGPGVAWADLNGDGYDDLIIGSGVGGNPGVFLNQQGRGFQPVQNVAWQQPVLQDQTTLLTREQADGSVVILAGSASHGSVTGSGAAFHEYIPSSGSVKGWMTDSSSSTGPMALTSWGTKEGLVLFVGGRLVPGRYPEPATSRILRLHGSDWQIDEELSAPLTRVGLVSGAVWTDLDGDGYPDLVLACEWSGLRVFTHHNGRLIDKTQDWGFHQYTGWWNGVASGDFTGDGRMDVIATNWGNNTRDEPYRDQPLRLYYGDFLNRGAVDLIEAYRDPGYGWVPHQTLGVLGPVMPWVQTRFNTYRDMAVASVETILGDYAQQAKWVEASVLEHRLFVNRGPSGFEVVSLPQEAQWAPAFAVCVGDLDGSGQEDVFFGQNFFGNDPATERYDAGRGLWLRGNGDGTFAAVHAAESGLYIFGDQRGAALGDLDRDGRVDLVVTQNGAITRLFRNRAAKPGLRVQLHGPDSNRLGYGSALRMEYAGSALGPVREVQSGSGYWSQNSPVQILGLREKPIAVWVRWPGEEWTRHDLISTAQEIRISHAGNLEVIR